MQAAHPIDRQALAEAEQWLGETLVLWGLRPGMARSWLGVLPSYWATGGAGELRIEYDPDLKLVACEVWSGDQRVFGVDDWLG